MLRNFFKEVASQTVQAVAASTISTVAFTVGSRAVQATRNNFFLAANPESSTPNPAPNNRPGSSPT